MINYKELFETIINDLNKKLELIGKSIVVINDREVKNTYDIIKFSLGIKNENTQNVKVIYDLQINLHSKKEFNDINFFYYKTLSDSFGLFLAVYESNYDMKNKKLENESE